VCQGVFEVVDGVAFAQGCASTACLDGVHCVGPSLHQRHRRQHLVLDLC
jgi:hypothetical protein